MARLAHYMGIVHPGSAFEVSTASIQAAPEGAPSGVPCTDVTMLQVTCRETVKGGMRNGMEYGMEYGMKYGMKCIEEMLKKDDKSMLWSHRHCQQVADTLS